MPTSFHPLADTVTSTFVHTETRAEVVSLGPLRADLFIAAAGLALRVVVVSGERTRLTDAYRDVMALTGGAWVVRTGERDLRDGITGRALDTVADVLSNADSGGRIAPRFLNLEQPDETQFVVSASVRHRADESTRLGRAAEIFSTLGGASTPASWGTHEPAESAWNKDDLTRYVRERMPADTRLVVTGDAGHPLIASIIARRTDAGVEEITTGLVGVGTPGSVGSTRAFEAAPRMLADLCSSAMPLVATVFTRVGRRDLMTRPFLRQDPEPVALMVGAPAVRALQLDPIDHAARFGAIIAGRARVPSIVYPLRAFPPRDRDSGWERLGEIVDALGADDIKRLTGLDLRRPKVPNAP